MAADSRDLAHFRRGDPLARVGGPAGTTDLAYFGRGVPFGAILTAPVALVTGGPITGGVAIDPLLTGTAGIDPLIAGEATIDVGTEARVGESYAFRLTNALQKALDPDTADTPITSLGGGETITVELIDATGAVVTGPTTLDNGGAGDDWYAMVTIPAAGRYSVRFKIVKGGRTRYLYDELLALAP
jgi:hypothetical protein